MAGKPGLISGVVRDPNGKPIIDARVYFTGGPEPLPDIAALTNSNGEFTLSAPSAGTYSIESNADGFSPKAATVAVASGQRLHLDIRLER
ncbi:MAG TPA: carboxypeptidase-like regulatory domain-containing protein [Blastocatellia bacterium]|nr:carboxypeptidase-like regulatory domain-containing protein [Blastocatellia bacterium]